MCLPSQNAAITESILKLHSICIIPSSAHIQTHTRRMPHGYGERTQVISSLIKGGQRWPAKHQENGRNSFLQRPQKIPTFWIPGLQRDDSFLSQSPRLGHSDVAAPGHNIIKQLLSATLLRVWAAFTYPEKCKRKAREMIVHAKLFNKGNSVPLTGSAF